MKKYIFGLVLVTILSAVGASSAQATGNHNPPSVSLSAIPMTISYGSSTNLTWNVYYYPDTCVGTGGANGWAGQRGINSTGSFNTGPLTSTTTYTITCSNIYGSDTDTVTVTVSGQQSNPPSVDLTASQNNISYGGATNIIWTTGGNPTSCNATNGTNGWSGAKSTAGGSFYTGVLFVTTTYNIVCSNNSGSASSTVTVTVAAQNNPPSVDLTASQTNLNYGEATTLYWVTTGNATSCNATNGTNGWAGAKSVSGGNFYTGALTNTTTYTITCSNSGGSATDTVTVNVVGQQNPPTVNLTAIPTSVSYGSSTILTWTVSNATSCVANSNPNTNWSNSKSSTGGQETISNLTATTFFNLFCTGPGGSNSSTVTVTVAAQNNPPSVDLTASQTNLNYGEATTLYWVTTGNATSCNATNGTNGWAGAKSVSGGNFYTGALTNTTTYTITCSNSGGSATDTVTVNVVGQQNPPTVNLYANQTTLPYNGSTNILWNVSNATTCNASGGTNGWSGVKSATGGTFYTGALASTTTYSITCSNNSGQNATDTVTVVVENQNVIPSVSTNSATNITYNNATLNGYVSANGGNYVSAWFEWGTNSGSLYNSTSQINYGATSGTIYNYSLGGITQNTTYYFRAVAQSQNGQKVYGNQMSFTTESSYTGCTYNCGNYNQPSVTTYGASNIGDNYATLNGYVNTNGTYTTTWFEWGTNSGSLYSQTNKTSTSSSGNFNQSLFNLSPNTTYYFRAVAQGNGGTVYGNILSFTTTGYINQNVCGYNNNCQPTAVTTLATSIGQTNARLNGLGILSGDNVSTNGYFEWGPTQALGNRTTENFIGTTSSNPFYANISGLVSGVTYYYRAVVTNQYGIARGDIASFRTNKVTIIDNSNSGNNDTIIYRNTGTNTTNVIRDTRNTNTVNTNNINRTATIVTNVNDVTGVSKPSLVFLNVSNNGSVFGQLNTVEYFVNYKNVSNENLKDVVLSVLLPKEMEFLTTTGGYFSTENNTVVVDIGNLFPGQEGSIRISVRVLDTAEFNKTLVVTAHLVYTIVSNNNQEEVFAYDQDVVEGGSQLTGNVLFSAGSFFPNTLIGWLLLIFVILLILMALRMAFGSGNRERVAYAPIQPRSRTQKEDSIA